MCNSNNMQHTGLSSNANLLPKSIFRWALWIVTIFTLVMNTLVLYGRMFSTVGDENRAINFIIRNLAGNYQKFKLTISVKHKNINILQPMQYYFSSRLAHGDLFNGNWLSRYCVHGSILSICSSMGVVKLMYYFRYNRCDFIRSKF